MSFDFHSRRTPRLASVGVIAAVLVGMTALSSACGSSREDFGNPGPGGGFSDGDGSLPDAGPSKCISQQVTGERVPLAITILLDRSGSMVGDKWTAATNAIRAFADRSEVVGMQMGLQFFPPISGDDCVPSSYTDLSVPIGLLPGNVLPIQQRLASTEPNGGTPMKTGLEGTIQSMSTWLSTSAPHATAVILVTDGDPAGCGSIDDVVNVARAGVAATPSVRTFAVGMDGASFKNLDKVAAAGGGDPKAFNVGGGAAVQQALIDALDAIRNDALGCEYILPVPSSEQGVLDPTSVDIKFTAGENDPEVTIRRVEGKGACGEMTGGFYYDDPQRPSRIILCPASCSSVRGATAQGKVDVVLGCIQRPR